MFEPIMSAVSIVCLATLILLPIGYFFIKMKQVPIAILCFLLLAFAVFSSVFRCYSDLNDLKCSECGCVASNSFELYCTQCGNVLQEDVILCSTSGCNFQCSIGDGFVFCPQCGEELPS